MTYLDDNNRLVTAPEPRWITSPKRLRVFFGGAPIVDSTRANLFRGGGPPVYYFPKDDVQQGALTVTGRTETNARGTMSLYDVRVGERSAEGAAWGYTETAADVPFLAGMLSFRWNAMDTWYEEEEEVFVHAKDPFKRIEAFRSARHVEVLAGGEKVGWRCLNGIVGSAGLRFTVSGCDIGPFRREAPSCSHLFHHTSCLDGRRDETIFATQAEEVPHGCRETCSDLRELEPAVMAGGLRGAGRTAVADG